MVDNTARVHRMLEQGNMLVTHTSVGAMIYRALIMILCCIRACAVVVLVIGHVLGMPTGQSLRGPHGVDLPEVRVYLDNTTSHNSKSM